ncbi:MAG: hypothetical protein U0Q15_05005 [Kineosporiaceae bacterium]
MIRDRRRHLGAALAAAALACGGAVALQTGPADAATTICEKFGSTTAGSYVIMNNKWGTDAAQCISTSDSGFTITQQDGVGNTSGAPVSYPAIYLGCHYKNCSPGSPLPKQISQLTNVPSSITYSYVGGTYDAAYDIWLDPTSKTDGVNQTEIMIWFNRQGSIQPIGSPVGNATVGGRTWQVWQGNNGGNDVVSYLAPSPITSWSFDVLDFIKDVITRGKAQTGWYLTSIQAGFEPWLGGAGLAVSGFSARVNDGGWTQPPTTTTPPPPTTTTAPPTTTSTPPSTKPTKTKPTKTVKYKTVKKCKVGKNGKKTCKTITKKAKASTPCSVDVASSASWGTGTAATLEVVEAGSWTLRLPATSLTQVWGASASVDGATAVLTGRGPATVGVVADSALAEPALSCGA